MAVIENPYEEMTHKQLLAYIHGAQELLSLRDWKIDLDIGNICPDIMENADSTESKKAFGRVNYDKTILTALIWVPLLRCKAVNISPFDTAMHEVAHIFYDYHKEELSVNIIANLLVRILKGKK